MKLRTLSKFLVSTVLAGCGGAPPAQAGPVGEGAISRAPKPRDASTSPTTTQSSSATPTALVPSPTTGASTPPSASPPASPPPVDAPPVDPTARWTWIPAAEIVEPLLPPDPDRVAAYVLAPDQAGQLVQAIVGPPVDVACAAASNPCAFATFSAGTRWIGIQRDGTIHRGTLAELAPGRTSRARALGAKAKDDPVLRAFPVFASRDGDGVQGVWLSHDGKALVSRPQRELLTETTPATASIDPHKPLPVGNVIDGSATLALITSAVPPLLPLKGDAREAAVLALGLSASDRAVVRATLALASSKRGGSSRAGLPIQGPELIRILPLGRGFLVELVTAAPYSSCTGGNSSGWAEVIVIGAQVYVTVHVEGRPGHCRGRRPPGYRDDSSEHPSAEARFFDDAARLELASVAAFELLAHELDVFGAPRALIERAHAARADEVRHAAQMTARATRHGVDLRPCGAPTFAPRALFEVALDNAVEGCVHEAFAATIAHFQAVTRLRSGSRM